ncbi:hypothetical protein GGF32_005032 [Allomyces javanicus]|nr:hypothetical protein GGF32_005032 [Allomyces javanicus]
MNRLWLDPHRPPALVEAPPALVEAPQPLQTQPPFSKDDNLFPWTAEPIFPVGLAHTLMGPLLAVPPSAAIHYDDDEIVILFALRAPTSVTSADSATYKVQVCEPVVLSDPGDPSTGRSLVSALVGESNAEPPLSTPTRTLLQDLLGVAPYLADLVRASGAAPTFVPCDSLWHLKIPVNAANQNGVATAPDSGLTQTSPAPRGRGRPLFRADADLDTNDSWRSPSPPIVYRSRPSSRSSSPSPPRWTSVRHSWRTRRPRSRTRSSTRCDRWSWNAARHDEPPPTVPAGAPEPIPFVAYLVGGPATRVGAVGTWRNRLNRAFDRVGTPQQVKLDKGGQCVRFWMPRVPGMVRDVMRESGMTIAGVRLEFHPADPRDMIPPRDRPRPRAVFVLFRPPPNLEDMFEVMRSMCLKSAVFDGKNLPPIYGFADLPPDDNDELRRHRFDGTVRDRDFPLHHGPPLVRGPTGHMDTSALIPFVAHLVGGSASRLTRLYSWRDRLTEAIAHLGVLRRVDLDLTQGLLHFWMPRAPGY